MHRRSPACQAAKCPAEKARQRYTDSGGLYLEVQPSGTKHWRWKYRFATKEKRLALGSYPEVALAAARRARDLARETLKSGTDPVEAKKEAKAAVLRRSETNLPSLVRSFSRDVPSVELVLSTQSGSALIAAVEEGELDIAITRCTASDLLDARPLFPMHVIALLPKRHTLAIKASLTVDDLRDQRLLLAPLPSTSRLLFDTACKAADVRPLIGLETHDLHAMKALADAGYGVAIAPSTLSLAGSQLKALPIRSDGRVLGVWTGVMWSRRHSSAVTKAFVDLAVRQLKLEYPGKRLRLPALAKFAS